MPELARLGSEIVNQSLKTDAPLKRKTLGTKRTLDPQQERTVM